MKQTTIMPDESEEIELPDQWEVEQGFITDQLEEEQEDKRFGKDDPTQYFKCYRCHRKVDRAKELMMQFSGGNQTLGLANILRDYCWSCYFVVKRENGGRLSSLTGREFAFVVTELKNQQQLPLFFGGKNRG